MNGDPILHAIALRVKRALLFAACSLLLTIGLWLWAVLGWYDKELIDLGALTRGALAAGADQRTPTLVLRGCAVIGGLVTTVAYLLVALWWRYRGDVHRRGARFVDARDGRE